MARPKTEVKVHDAVMSLLAERGYAAMTMEAIATSAGVSKQTVYRTWPSKSAVVFDALLARSEAPSGEISIPDSGDLEADLIELIVGTIAEMTDPTNDRLFRAITAELQTDVGLSTELNARLLLPQLNAVTQRLRVEGIRDPEDVVELLYGPVFHRWLLRTRPFTDVWVTRHVARTLRAADTEPT